MPTPTSIDRTMAWLIQAGYCYNKYRTRDLIELPNPECRFQPPRPGSMPEKPRILKQSEADFPAAEEQPCLALKAFSFS